MVFKYRLPDGTWVDIPAIRGKKGDTGEPGPKGDPGEKGEKGDPAPQDILDALSEYTGLVFGTYVAGEDIKLDKLVGSSVAVRIKPITRTGIDLLAYTKSGSRLYSLDISIPATSDEPEVMQVEKNIPNDFGYWRIAIYGQANRSAIVSVYRADAGNLQLLSNIVGVIDGAKLLTGSVTPDKTSFIGVMSDNLFDPDTSLIDHRIIPSQHQIVSDTWSNGFVVSNAIPVVAGASYYSGLTGDTFKYCWCDAAGNPTSNDEWYGVMQGSTVPLIAPEGAATLRVMTSTKYIDSTQVNKDSFKPYDRYKFSIDPSLLPESGGGGETGGGKVVTAMDVLGEKTMARKSVASLAANTLSELTNFPWYIKTGLAFSASAKFASFTSISVGQGIDAAKLGMWVTVNATQFSINNKDVNGNPINPTTGTHGMTIANDIDVAVSVNDSLDLTLVISSNGVTKMFRYDRQSWGPHARGGHAGTIGVKSETALTDVVITAGCDKLNKAVWVFGDSYLDMQSTRWPWYAWKNGCYDWLHVGLAGGQSAELYADLLRCAALARPQYIVWCLGMNDTDADWATTYDTLKTLCTNRGITLICATIPNTPIKDKTTINATVKASGYRYIDFAHAVGADEYPSSWYSGMLNGGDKVHPTATGAEALAKQAMKDFALLSGTEHKTINGESILGAGNLEIGPEVVQTTGTATDKVMSQKAVTEALAGAGGGKASVVLRPFDDVQTAYNMTAMDFATGTFTIDGTHNIAVGDMVTIIPNFKVSRTYSNMVTQRLNKMVSGAYPCAAVTGVDGNNVVVEGFINASQSALTANQWLIVKRSHSRVVIELPDYFKHKEISVRIQGFTTQTTGWNNSTINTVKGTTIGNYTNKITADCGHGSYLDELCEFYMDRAIRYDMAAICRMDTTGSYRTNYVVVQGNSYNMADTDHIWFEPNLCVYGNYITIKEL